MIRYPRVGFAALAAATIAAAGIFGGGTVTRAADAPTNYNGKKAPAIEALAKTYSGIDECTNPGRGRSLVSITGMAKISDSSYQLFYSYKDGSGTWLSDNVTLTQLDTGFWILRCTQGGGMGRTGYAVVKQ